MGEYILTINTGSSTIKLSLFDREVRERLAAGLVDWSGGAGGATMVLERPQAAPEHSPLGVTDYRGALKYAIPALMETAAAARKAPARIVAVGHRVVHGGDRLRESVRLDDGVCALIARYAELAPLHNPPALEGIAAARSLLPDVPHVGVFDTAFYAHLPPEGYIYPVPYAWYTDYGIRRFGFHGISHAYCAARAAELMGRAPASLRMVCCHLGNGCSATAVQNGVAVATTMGFTPMEGLMMGSRSGSIDPGIFFYMLKHLTVEQLDEALNHRSGLLGVSGISSDFRQIEAAAQAGHERARLAFNLLAGQVRAVIGALAVTMGGLDGLVFTGGIGEHAASLRAAACSGLTCLGVLLDEEKNTACAPDMDIAARDVRVFVIHTREDMLIARETRRTVL
jgi:acetate kinase